MRKRLMLLWTPLVLGLALVLPSSTLATSYGNISRTNQYCSGADTVNASFKLVKFSGFYAYKLTITFKGQEFYGGKWHSVYNIGTESKVVDTFGKASYAAHAWYNPANGYHGRILAIGKIWNSASHVLASGKSTSGYC